MFYHMLLTKNGVKRQKITRHVRETPQTLKANDITTAKWNPNTESIDNPIQRY
jgi:hypothetical protein